MFTPDGEQIDPNKALQSEKADNQLLYPNKDPIEPKSSHLSQKEEAQDEEAM